ncbi:MAG: YkgJ family cysteine cluster protein [Candidatus Heimdallarchaeota archaeon]
MWNCKGCENSCCITKNPQLTIADVKRIDDDDNIFFDGGVFRIKKVNGACTFFKGGLCSIYNERPLSCRMYPYNPIFHQGRKGFTLNIEIDKTCKEITRGHSFNVKPTALQWRKERIEHDMVYKK